MPDRKPTLAQRVARWLDKSHGRAPQQPQRRSYSAARNTNTTLGFGSSSNASADSELSMSLAVLRARSRQVVRDSAYGKRAQLIIVNNVIGTGIGMQAQVGTTRGGQADRVNDSIEAAWEQWMAAASCHTGGELHLHDIERLAMAEIFEAGEVIIRKHYRAFGGSSVPLALEVIEAERLASDLVDPSVGITAGIDYRMGVEVDAFGRPLAYWIRERHPGDIRARAGVKDRFERVPASDIWHLRIIDRWPQTRGVPWMHTALRKIDDLNEYSQHEVSAARASAAYFATITSPADAGPAPDNNSPVTSSVDAYGQQVMDIDPLTIQSLNPGETLNFHTPNRPNPGLDPFMRAMLREVAAGTGVSYESLSRDYSQSNYSSSRLALLDDRDLYRTLQQWWVRQFRRPLHALWMQQAVLAGAISAVAPAAYAVDPAKYTAVLFKPRGWSWVDPTKEVQAYKEAIRAGLTTATDVIAATAGGLDIEDVVKTRQRELAMFEAAGIEVDTTVSAPPEPAPSQADPASAPDDEDDAPEDAAGRHQDHAQRVVRLQVGQP